MAGVDLYWLPLGAGGHFVRLNGRVYEALTARLQRPPARPRGNSNITRQQERASGVGVYLQGIDSSEIISTVHGRPSATISATAGLTMRR